MYVLQANVRLLTVQTHTGRFFVFVEVALQGECLSASLTNVGFAGGMRLNMSAQVGLIGEGLIAYRTLERFLSSVSAYVTLQEPWTTETFTTVRTLTALAVCPDVHAVGRHGDVHLVAVRTLSGLLVRDAAVSLAMTGQVAGSAVTFSTFRTDVRVLGRVVGHDGRRNFVVVQDLLHDGRQYRVVQVGHVATGDDDRRILYRPLELGH